MDITYPIISPWTPPVVVVHREQLLKYHFGAKQRNPTYLFAPDLVCRAKLRERDN